MAPRETLKQRIQYLVEHGGEYPEDRPRDWKGWAILGMLAAITVMEAVQLLQ